MEFFDTHCHLNLFQDQTSLKSIIQRALDSGVNKIVVPGIDASTSRRAVEMAEVFSLVYAAVGIHPHEVSKYTAEDLKDIEEMAALPKVVAIGEIGLDYHYPPINKEAQNTLLRNMLEISEGVDKPIILHNRQSMADLLRAIQTWAKNQKTSSPQQKVVNGVFHAFEGNTSDALLLRELKFMIGIGGPVTFKNNIQLHELIKNIGMENIVLETDSPYLSPHPFRGLQNEPSRIPLIAQKVADLLEIQVELVAERTTLNAKKIFLME